MKKAKCSRTDFTKTSFDQLDTKATAVKKGLGDNTASFPAPPVSPAVIGGLIDAYNSTYSAYERGGQDQKPAFMAVRTSLLAAMSDNADYVDEIAKGNQELIVAAGYVPTKTSKTPVPEPGQPKGVRAKRGSAIGEMWVECPAQAEATFYGLIASEGAPLAGIKFINGQLHLGNNSNAFIDMNQGRKKHLQGLKPGVMYYFYMYAGNRNGISPLSTVVELMAA